MDVSPAEDALNLENVLVNQPPTKNTVLSDLPPVKDQNSEIVFHENKVNHHFYATLQRPVMS